eukprot:gene16750-23023_t
MLQAALELDSAALELNSMNMPMGASGFILPLTATAITLLVIRQGVGAAGVMASKSGNTDRFTKFLQVLPTVLYSLTVAALYFKVQAPQAVMLHWTATAVFTMSFQQALRSPTVQSFVTLPSKEVMGQKLLKAIADITEAVPKQDIVAGGPVYDLAQLPHDIVKRVSETGNSDVLTIMGAQLSAQNRFPEAMYCFDKALLLQSNHVRAHYSKGQVCSIN